MMESTNQQVAETRKYGNDFRDYAIPRNEFETNNESSGQSSLVLPDAFYEDLPSTLSEVVSLASSKTERDTLLLGSITCLSAAFDNVYGIYDSRKVYPNLYLFVSAPAGVGKGPLGFCRDLVMPIHHHLRELAKQEEAEYRRAVKEKMKSEDAEPLQEPPQRMFLIPANSSSASVQRILADNNGVGLMFETEGDTLSQTLSHEYGQYSDILRKAFHHEPITMSRKLNREYLEIDEPKLSVALAGTLEQVRRLIPDAENGLMSRFMFYCLPFSSETRDVFDPTGDEKPMRFKDIGNKLYEKIKRFRGQGTYKFSLCNDDKETFVGFLDILVKNCIEVDHDLLGTAHRLGLIGFRIMMILSALRELDEQKANDRPIYEDEIPLMCTSGDFVKGSLLMFKLKDHSIRIYNEITLPASNHAMSPAQRRRGSILSQLPASFTTADYNATVAANGYNVRTAEIWLNKFIDDGLIQRIAQGVYQKVQ